MGRSATRKRAKHRDKRNIANRGARRNWLVGAILAIGVAAGVVAWQWPGTLWGYKKAPAFSLQSSTGRAVSLEDFRGKKEVVLIFYMGAG